MLNGFGERAFFRIDDAVTGGMTWRADLAHNQAEAAAARSIPRSAPAR